MSNMTSNNNAPQRIAQPIARDEANSRRMPFAAVAVLVAGITIFGTGCRPSGKNFTSREEINKYCGKNLICQNVELDAFVKRTKTDTERLKKENKLLENERTRLERGLKQKIAELHARGDFLFKKKDYDGAAEAYGKLIGIEEKNSENFNKLGLALMGAENYESAFNSFRIARNMRPNNLEYMLNQGKALFEMDKTLQAIGIFNEVIKRDPKNAEAYYQLGVAYEDGDLHKKALPYFEKAVSLQPRNSEYVGGLGICKFMMKNYKEAAALFEKAIGMGGLGEDLLDAQGNLAAAYFQMGEYQKAIAGFARLSEIDQAEATWPAGAGEACRMRGDYKAAIDWFGKAIERAPDAPGLYEKRASVFKALGQFGEANNDLKQAKSLRRQQREQEKQKQREEKNHEKQERHDGVHAPVNSVS